MWGFHAFYSSSVPTHATGATLLLLSECLNRHADFRLNGASLPRRGGRGCPGHANSPSMAARARRPASHGPRHPLPPRRCLRSTMHRRSTCKAVRWLRRKETVRGRALGIVRGHGCPRPSCHGWRFLRIPRALPRAGSELRSHHYSRQNSYPGTPFPRRTRATKRCSPTLGVRQGQKQRPEEERITPRARAVRGGWGGKGRRRRCRGVCPRRSCRCLPCRPRRCGSPSAGECSCASRR